MTGKVDHHIFELFIRFVLAPLVLDGPINGDAFLAWINQFLAPHLRRGDTVVMDKISDVNLHDGGQLGNVSQGVSASLPGALLRGTVATPIAPPTPPPRATGRGRRNRPRRTDTMAPTTPG